MARIPAPVAAVRTAVRRSLAGTPSGSLVLVACSGGADSMALAAATAFVAPRLGLLPGLITVDHRLQPGSAGRAADVAAWASAHGFAPVEVAPVDVTGHPGGPEAAARSARYAALSEAAERHRAAAVLLGHTRDDQAETVLLALARGAGPRGLSGMPYRKGVFLRPFLNVSRAEARKACAALGLAVWDDPHNADPAYARSRVRTDLIPALVAALGPAVVDNLARTAAQLAADNAALDALAETARRAAATARRAGTVNAMGATPGATEDAGENVATPGGTVSADDNAATAGRSGGAENAATPGEVTALSVAALSGLPDAIRTRVLHAWARDLGAPGSALSHRHVAALDALVTDWHGQGPTILPGGIAVARRSGELIRLAPTEREAGPAADG